jgi:hypothetical protein
VWASLRKGKTAVIPAEEMDRRHHPSRSPTRLALTDGERALQIRVGQKLNVALVLDRMHVFENSGRPPTSSMPRQVGDRSLGPGPNPTDPVRGGGPSGQGDPSVYHQRALFGPQPKTVNAAAHYLYRYCGPNAL